MSRGSLATDKLPHAAVMRANLSLARALKSAFQVRTPSGATSSISYTSTKLVTRLVSTECTDIFSRRVAGVRLANGSQRCR